MLNIVVAFVARPKISLKQIAVGIGFATTRISTFYFPMRGIVAAGITGGLRYAALIPAKNMKARGRIAGHVAILL